MSVSSNQIAAVLASVPTQLFIGGEWRDSSDGATFDVENPATGEVIAKVASATSDDAGAAMDAAAGAQREWAATAPRVRSDILRRAYDLVVEHVDDLALLMSLEMGKPVAEARGEVTYGAEFLRWFSEEAVRHYGRYYDAPEGTLRMMVRHKPVGPCLLVTPWNFPLAMATRKLGPALAAGCTAIVKQARLTPLTTLLLTSYLVEAGVPAGVVNVLPSASASAVSDPILADPRLRKLSFTGSTGVGKKLLQTCAGSVLRTSMELGGNAPFLVFEDADLDKAAAGALAAKMRNMGEACTSAQRFIVHESVIDAFAEKLAEKMAGLTLGPGTEEGVTCGPLVDGGQRDTVRELVDDAVAAGARVVTGGSAPDRPGYFYEPTLLTGVPRTARVFTEEIFGPVAPLFPFSTEDEAVEMANDTEYGLASYVFTSDLKRAHRIGDRLEFGLVGINAGVISNAAAPFGGVKQSGLGREGGAEGLAEYTTVQYLGMESPSA